MSGGGAAAADAAAVAAADDRYTKRNLLQLLEAEYADEACQLVFGALSSLPSLDPKHLSQLLTAVGQAQSATVAPDDWHRVLSLFALEVTKSVHQIVLNILLRELRQLSGHIKYWKKSIQSPVSHFLVNGRWEWFRNRPRGLEWSGLMGSLLPFGGQSQWLQYLSHMQRADVNEKLDKLQQCEESFASQVGHLHLWIDAMEKITTLRLEVRSFCPYVTKLYEFVSAQESREAKTAPHVLQALQDTLHALPEFELWFVTQLDPLRKPSHVRRHWLGYSVAAVGTAVVANRVIANREAIGAWGRATARDGAAFFHTHVTEPLGTIYHNVFHTFRDRQNLAASRDSLADSRRSLTNMLVEFGSTPAGQAQEAAKLEGKSHALYLEELPKRAAAHDMSIVMPRYERDVRQPLRSLANGELVRGLLIQVQKVKVDSEAAMLAMDQVLKANELNFSVLAIVPAVLLFGAALMGVRRLIFRRPSRTQLHRRMRRVLRGVETILIQHYGSGKALANKHMGFLLLLLQKLEDLVRNGLPAHEQTDILADIAQLRSVDLDVQQKHLMIARMYRAYTLDDGVKVAV